MLIKDDYFKNIFNTVREAILILDENMRVQSANRSFFKTFKVDAANTIGSLLYDLGNGQWNIPELRVLLEDILPKNDTVDDYKIEHNFESIGQKTMLLNASKIRDKKNDLPIILLAIEDITERREIENGLEKVRKELEVTKISEDEAREYAESIINTVREPLIALDQDLRVVTASRSFYEVFKVNPKETVGQLIYDLGNKQWNIPKLRELLETILPQKTTFDNYEVEHEFAAIGRRIMLLNARQIQRKLGKERIILLAIEDITERKRLEDLLTESEERYRRIFETASDGIVLLEKREGNIAHVNPAAEKMLGYPKEECIGKNLQDIGVSLDMSDFPTIMQTLNKSGIINYDDVQVKTKSGQYIDTDIYMVDRARLAQCNIRDVTERKKLEEQLLQSQKMESIGTLAGGIAHDFNNILTAIIGYASVTKMKMPEDDPLRHNLEQILASSERAAVLTQSLLAFSRKQISNPEPVNLNEIVKKAEKFLSRVIGEDIELKMILSDNGLTVMADAGQIEQTLMNLTTNARDAMPKGGVLTIQTEPVEFDSEFVKAFGYGEVGKYACIIISDTGIGMDKATKEKIYDPFFTTKEVGKGTGLGLPMVYGIVKQHNGYINCYSELGKGTSFKIYLPLFESMPVSKTVTEGAAVAVPTGGTETILVAEDEESVRRLMKEVLEEDGYKVIEAADGEEAVNKFMENKDKIDLLLLDIVMPKMNGKEVYERIKKIKPDIKLLMASGYPADFITQKGIIEEGFNFVAKPMSPTKLLMKVRGVLDK